jgi:hypothetical protein
MTPLAFFKVWFDEEIDMRLVHMRVVLAMGFALAATSGQAETCYQNGGVTTCGNGVSAHRPAT